GRLVQAQVRERRYAVQRAYLLGAPQRIAAGVGGERQRDQRVTQRHPARRVLDGDLYRRTDRLAGACVAERGGEGHPGRRGRGRRPVAPAIVQQLVEV